MGNELERIDGEVELIQDGDGIAVIGAPGAVDRFVASTGLAWKDLGFSRLRPMLTYGAVAAEAASHIAANAGRWMKLTEESARFAKGALVTNSSTGNLHAIVRGEAGKFVKNLQFVKNPGTLLTNPATYAGVAGLMAQVAMQQAIEEITDYLAKIDAKIDDLLRAQKDAVLSEMIGVQLVIEEAMAIRDKVGYVSETTWSKVQATSATVASTQGYALLQLEALSEKVEDTKKVGDLVDLTAQVEKETQEWLAVLARCFQLQDAIGVLEIDRVLQDSAGEPEEVNRHREGMQIARESRRRGISESVVQLLGRMEEAAKHANRRVLISPISAPKVVHTTNRVTHNVVEFQTRLGIDPARETLVAKTFGQALEEVRDFGIVGAEAIKDLGGEVFDNARVGLGKMLIGIGDRISGNNSLKQQPEGGDER